MTDPLGLEPAPVPSQEPTAAPELDRYAPVTPPPDGAMQRHEQMGHGHWQRESSARDKCCAVALTFDAELGFLVPLSHEIQFSQDGSEIDYIDDAGQDVLFPFTRLQAHLRLLRSHGITLLYQPLELVSQEIAPRDLRVDDEEFEAGTPMTYRYGFPFWRLAYTYYLATVEPNQPGWELGLGLGLQIRNATIEFASLDGEQFRSNRDVGPVPLLRAATRYTTRHRVFFEGEVDGFYAPVKYLNGGDSDVEGSIVDLNVRSGLSFHRNSEAYLNVRYLAGGAEGTSSNDEGPGDGYSSNWLHFLTVSLGARLTVW